MSICRVIISIFNNLKDNIQSASQNEADKISAQQVVEPIVQCYSSGKRSLKELSIDALYNMMLTDSEYIDLAVSLNLSNHIFTHIFSPHQPLIYKSLRCLLVIVKKCPNVPSLFTDFDSAVERLMVLLNSYSKDEGQTSMYINVSYSIEIRNLAMKILFMFIKKAKGSKDFIKAINDNFIDDVTRETVELFQLRIGFQGKTTVDEGYNDFLIISLGSWLWMSIKI